MRRNKTSAQNSDDVESDVKKKKKRMRPRERAEGRGRPDPANDRAASGL